MHALGLGLDAALDELARSRGRAPPGRRRRRSRRRDRLAVRADRRRAPGGRDGLAGHGSLLLLAVGRRWSGGDERARRCPAARRSGPVAAGPSGRSRRRRRSPRARKDRGPTGRAGARQPDRPAEEADQRPPERHERRATARSRPAAGRWPTARTPARARRSAAESPARAPRRGAPTQPDRAVAGGRGVEGREDSGVRDRDRRRHQQDAGRAGRPGSGVTRSPRPSTRAGPPARKNGTSEPSEPRRVAAVGRRARRPRPRARRRARPRRRDAAGEAGRDRDPLLEPGGEGRRGAGPARPAGADGARARGERPQHEVVRRRARRRGRVTWSVSAVAGDRREAQPVGQGERRDDRVERRGSRRRGARRPRGSG